MKVLAAAVLLAVAHPRTVAPVDSGDGVRRVTREHSTVALPLRDRDCTSSSRDAASAPTTVAAVAGDGREPAPVEASAREKGLEANAATARKLAAYTSRAGRTRTPARPSTSRRRRPARPRAALTPSAGPSSA